VPFDPVKAVGGELHLPPPLQDELSPRPVADPVADLVDDDGSYDAERYGAPEADLTLLDQHAGGKEYGSARETDASGPEHHAEENDQVPVMLDQGIELAVDA
jgi:hypothetical protein